MLGGRGHDLDDVALPQGVAERHQLAVDLGAHTMMAHIRVDGIGEVEGRGALGEGLHVALGREHVDLVGEKIDPDGVEEFLRVRDVAL